MTNRNAARQKDLHSRLTASSPGATQQSKTAPSVDSQHHRWGIVVATVIVAIGGIVRFRASLDNFWLDEIWSWRFAYVAKSYWQIATQMPHDNNQILNTWIIYALSPDADWVMYRIPAVLAGIGTVIIAGASGLRRSPAECLVSLLITSSSFVLIQYSSEARGYAYLLFFTMLCIWILERSSLQRRRFADWVFGLSASLGFLGHFLFAAPYAGLLIWTFVIAIREKASWKSRLFFFARLHSLPVLLIATLAYCYGKRPMTGGGDRNPLLGVLIETGSLAAGGPARGALAVCCCCLVCITFVAGLRILFLRREGFGYFVAVTIVTLGSMIGLTGFDTIYVRHFLVPLFCFLLIASRLLADAWTRGSIGKIVTGFVLAAMLAGNSVHTFNLLKYGRGGYQDAVAFLLTQTERPIVMVGSDHDFRNETVLRFYWLMQTNQKPIVYVKHGEWPPEGPEWFISHSFEQPVRADSEIEISGIRYRLARTYPYSGLSGWNWAVYRKMNTMDEYFSEKSGREWGSPEVSAATLASSGPLNPCPIIPVFESEEICSRIARISRNKCVCTPMLRGAGQSLFCFPLPLQNPSRRFTGFDR